MTVAGIWILIAGCVVSLLITIITTKKRPEQFELYHILSLVTLFVFAFIAIFPWVLSGHTSSQDSRKFFIFLEAYMLLRILYFNEVSKKLPAFIPNEKTPPRTIKVRDDVERVKGIEPSYPAWKAGVLPLNYTRVPG